MTSADQSSTEDIDARKDAVDRLERVLDIQIEAINEIDAKAEYVTRLVAILLGIILSAFSVATQVDEIPLPEPSVPTIIAFGGAIGLLLLSMGAAIITYLSSKFKIGLSYKVGYLLSDPGYKTTVDTHIRRVIGTYAHDIEQNKTVIETNSRRFRAALTFLLLGILYFAISVVLLVIPGSVVLEWSILLLTTVIAVLVGGYIFTGRYLTIQPESYDNE